MTHGDHGMSASTTTPALAPRARSRSCHGESVGGSRRRARASALTKLSGEIDFAFRASNPASSTSSASGADTNQPDEGDGDGDGDGAAARPLRETSEPLQSGDYVAALQLGKRARPAPLVAAARRRPAQGARDTQREDRLVWDINDLRQELRRLRDHKRAMATRLVYRSVATPDAVFKVTKAYFTMFAGGFETGPLAARHEAFLRSVVDDDVVTCSQLRGADALVEQWRRYADLFALRDYTLRSVRATALDDAPILEVACGYHVFVTRRTLEHLFPHVVGDPYLVQRVVGQKLACDSRVTFAFDARGKIVQYDDDSDFVAAFARLLRNPRDLAALMDGALITERSLIGELEHVHGS